MYISIPTNKVEPLSVQGSIELCLVGSISLPWRHDYLEGLTQMIDTNNAWTKFCGWLQHQVDQKLVCIMTTTSTKQTFFVLEIYINTMKVMKVCCTLTDFTSCVHDCKGITCWQVWLLWNWEDECFLGECFYLKLKPNLRAVNVPITQKCWSYCTKCCSCQ